MKGLFYFIFHVQRSRTKSVAFTLQSEILKLTESTVNFLTWTTLDLMAPSSLMAVLHLRLEETPEVLRVS
jgi:hypothetical protein